jgi:hypothetical protein
MPVPCNGCTACCKQQRIILGKQDNIDHYFVVPTRRGNDGVIEWMLAHKVNGDCWYLTDTGCSIHGRAPKACQQFDCRVWYAAFNPVEREMLLRSPLDAPTARAAKLRMP